MGDFKSKAGAASALQSQLDKFKTELKEIRDEITPSHPFSDSFWERYYEFVYGRQGKTLKKVVENLESRLSEQEKLTRMILAHLGVEYAKLTEETKTGKHEKEVLRKIKKQKSENPRYKAR